jgi:hypothetical protein
MKPRFEFRFLLPAGALLLAMGAAIPARAQAAAPEDLSRGVARIGLMDGEVSVRRGDSGEWVAGVINAPLLTDDRIATGQNSREFSRGSSIRLGERPENRRERRNPPGATGERAVSHRDCSRHGDLSDRAAVPGGY